MEESGILENTAVEQEEMLDDDEEVSHSPLCVSLQVIHLALYFLGRCVIPHQSSKCSCHGGARHHSRSGTLRCLN